jgi:hypothetical protein
MTLSALIRKRNTRNLATAIPAISATQPKEEPATVARIATVAVANPKEEKTAPPAKVGAGATAAEPFTPTIRQPSAPLSDYVPANGQELARMLERAQRGEALGLPAREADALADRLHLRDREGDARRLCLECANLRAAADGWRCAALRQPLPRDLVMTQLQRCDKFEGVELRFPHASRWPRGEPPHYWPSY